MKKTLLKQSFLLAIITGIIACGTPGGDPKAVAKHFFEALKTMNIDEASKYATKDSKSMLDMIKMGMSMAPKNIDSIKTEMGKQKITYSEPVINGDEATVSVMVDEKEKTDFKLKKEDGEWKVAFDKNSLMKTGMEKMEDHGASEADMKEAEDAMKTLNSDSLKNALKEAADVIDSIKP